MKALGKLTLLLFLCRPAGAAEPTLRSEALAPILREHGVRQADADRLAPIIGRGANWYRSHLGKVPPRAPLSEEVEMPLDELGLAIHRNHLRGDQTVELLRALALAIHPNLRQATGSVGPIADEMREHRVPGDAIYDYLLPGLKEGMARRMAGQPPSPGGLAELQNGLAFANRYNLPAATLALQLHQLLAAIEEAEQPNKDH